jgi:putative tryptophan/tyrosine transport system substrate-binding protein
MKIVKALWLMVVMVISISAVLLFSDLENRQARRIKAKRPFPLVAVVQYSSTTLLDSHVAGVVDGLTKRGMVAPDGKNLHKFNANGELSMANTIAKEITNGQYEVVITSSTVMLQTFAKVNREVKKLHIFGAVTDPQGAGVGITGREPSQHPEYLAGIGTFQPVIKAFRIVRELNPRIKKVGVVWNPGEQCSDACLKQARQVCAELGIELVEAIATNTNEVAEAVRSLLAKGVEAVWIGGDTVAISSSGMIIKLAGEAGVPVFTNEPKDADRGALFGLGANYFTVGQYTGEMAADILEGIKKPSDIRIENVVPELLEINREVLTRMGKNWLIPQSVQEVLDQQSGKTSS